MAEIQGPCLLEHLDGLSDPALSPVHNPQVVMGRRVAGVLLGRPAVGVLGPSKVSSIEEDVPQPEEDLCHVFPAAKGLQQEINRLLVPTPAPQLLGPGESPPHEVRPCGNAQRSRVGERRSEIRSFTVWMSSHVWCLGLPLALLAFRKR